MLPNQLINTNSHITYMCTQKLTTGHHHVEFQTYASFNLIKCQPKLKT